MAIMSGPGESWPQVTRKVEEKAWRVVPVREGQERERNPVVGTVMSVVEADVGCENSVVVVVAVRVRVMVLVSPLELEFVSEPVSILNPAFEHFLLISRMARLPPRPPPIPLAIMTNIKIRASQNVGRRTPQIVFSWGDGGG